MKAVILTRVSTKMQEDGLSLDAQKNRLIEYAERKNLEVIKHFEIIESSTRGNRKQFKEMLDFCKMQNETIAIVADTVDRVQRSFKESVLLDELMRQNKIELHFFREGMVLNSQSSSVDIMRWDFSVMGAKAYVLQLSENVKRSTDLKVRSGERSGIAPIGYENYVTEDGKRSVRKKEPKASIIKQLFEMYSMGHSSVGELLHYANMMGLLSKSGKKIARTTIFYILDNPFYYGEMNTKKGLIRHVYEPIITKELWDRCQEQKALNNFNNRPGHVANDLFVLQGLIRCGTTNSICTCERKKKKYNYIFCYREDKTRVYIPEHIILDKITEILERIRLPEHVMTEMKEDLKKMKSKEKAYCKQETAKLKQDMEELKKKMDHLFDLRLEGEIEREMFDAKRMDLELKIGRVQDKIIAHEKADNRFNETILDLLDISKEAKNIFLSARKVEQKRFLLRFIFKTMILTEDTLAYELNFPFKEFEYSNIARMEREKLELAGSKKTQGFQGNESKNAEEKIEKELELHFSHKNQGFRLKNLNPVQSGWSELAVLEMKF